MFEEGKIKFSDIKTFLETNPDGVESSSIAGWSAPFKMPNELDAFGQAVGSLRGGSSYTQSSYSFSEFRGITKADLPVISSNSIINQTITSFVFNFSYQIVASNMSGDKNHPFLYTINNNASVGSLTVSNTGLISGVIDVSSKTIVNNSLTLSFNAIAVNYAGASVQPITLNLTVSLPNEKPEIEIIGLNPKYLITGDTYNDEGATAFDPEDGSLTSSIVTTNPVNTAAAGTYQVKYNVQDSQGLAADEKIRTVIVNLPANDPPVITRTGPASVTIVQNTTYTDQGATASDAQDGNITSRIVTVNPVNTSVPATYRITYNVTDLGGLSADQVTRIVLVEPEPNTPPTITLTGSAAVSVNAGSTYTDQGATATDAQDGNLTSQIVVTTSEGGSNANILTTNPRILTITYTVTDSGGMSASTSRQVTVVNTPPVITLIGDPVVNIGSTTTSTPADIINGLPVGTTIRGEYVMIGPYAASSDITFTKSNTILSQNDGWGRPFSNYASFDIGFTSGTDYNSGHSVIYFRDNNGTLQMKAEGNFMTQSNAGVMASVWRDVSFTSRPGTGQNSGFTIFMEAEHMPDHTTSFYAGEWSEGITV